MAEEWTWTDLEIDDSSVSTRAAWESEINNRVPDAPGVYLWRLKFGASLEHNSNLRQFLDDLNGELRRPIGFIPESALNPSVRLHGLRIGGGELTEAKSQFLKDRYGNGVAKRQLSTFVRSLDRFAPAIYIGKADSLQARLLQHVRGDTPLDLYVRESLHRDWRSIAASIMQLPATHTQDASFSTELSNLLEMIAQLALAPHGVQRQG